MKTKQITIISVLVVIAGLAILAYPIISNMMFQKSQQELIDFYDSQINEIPEKTKDSMMEECRKYNSGLLDSKVQLTDPFDADALQIEEHPYVDLLNQNGDGSMGSIEIPGINCKLVIYHGTEEAVLAKGVGHLQGTSLPIGGKGTHSVLSGHTGTADKELFTNLDQLDTGDVFYIHVWGETLAYQVDNKEVVLPDETDSLYIDRESDLVTLVTCTPYGINSHRLLVRGTRISYEEAKKIEKQGSRVLLNTWSTQYVYAILTGILISVAIVLAIIFVYRRIHKKRMAKEKK